MTTLLWLATAFGAPDYDDITCAELAEGPPKGAKALVESVLPRIQRLRRIATADKEIPRPDEAFLQSWIDTSLPRDALGVQAVIAGSDAEPQLVLELQAPDRPALVEANVTVIIDTTSSMTTVYTREFPMLQDGPPTALQRPVVRLTMAKEALHLLVDSLPEGSRLSIVAAEGARGRRVLQPTTSVASMRRAIDLLEHEMLESTDPLLSDILEKSGRETFKRCADNRALLFTFRTDNATMSNAVKAIGSFGAADAQIWTFAVGSMEELDIKRFVDDQPNNQATWILNSRSDTQLVWRTLFTAGGAVARDVQLKVSAGAQTLLDETFPALLSGAHLAKVVDLPGTEDISVSLSAGGELVTQLAPASTEPSPPWARGRLAAAAWSRGENPIDREPARGAPNELAAWSVITGGEPVPDPKVQLTSVWADPGPGGPYIVLDLYPWVDDFQAVDLELETDSGTFEPIAWEEFPRRWRLVFRADGERARLRYLDDTTAWVTLDSPGKRSANDVIIRHGLERVGTTTLLPNAEAAAAMYAPDDILTSLVARMHYELEDMPNAGDWAGRCIDAPAGRIAADCRLILGKSWEAREDDVKAEEIYLDGVVRYPWAHPLWYAAGEVAYRATRYDEAEQRFLEAMAYGAPSNPTCVRLADVMEQRELPGLAAVALSRALIVDPTDEAVRERLFDLFEAGWDKAPRQWGKIGTVRPPRGKTSVAWLKVLLFRWGQAYRRELVLRPESTYRWHSEIPRPFDALRFEKTLLSAAYRIGYTPGTIPPHRVKYANEIEDILLMQEPPVR